MPKNQQNKTIEWLCEGLPSAKAHILQNGEVEVLDHLTFNMKILEDFHRGTISIFCAHFSLDKIAAKYTETYKLKYYWLRGINTVSTPKVALRKDAVLYYDNHTAPLILFSKIFNAIDHSRLIHARYRDDDVYLVAMQHRGVYTKKYYYKSSERKWIQYNARSQRSYTEPSPVFRAYSIRTPT